MKMRTLTNIFLNGKGLRLVFVTCYMINLVLISEYSSVVGKVLTRETTLKTGNKQIEDEKNRKNLLESYDEYYEDSFEDQLTQNFVDEYDGDGEVRFITEDDIEEKFEESDDDFVHQRGTAQLDSRCPDLPQPSKATENLCQARMCRHDADCKHLGKVSSYVEGVKNTHQSFICCFNGCINSCLLRVDPPKAFDWLEETQLKDINNNGTSKGGVYISGSSHTLNPKTLLKDDDETTISDKITLPGGCLITKKQLEELRLFRKYDHVETCTCLKGEVVCQINPKVSLKSELLGSKLAI